MSEQTSLDVSCQQCRDLLSDYIDRELSASEREFVEKHLESCVKCGSESSRMLGLKKIVQHWNGVKGSGEFRQSVMKQMIRESQQVPSEQFTDAASAAGAPAPAEARPADSEVDEGEGDEKRLPPIWILLVAGALAVAAYYIVLWLRGI